MKKTKLWIPAHGFVKDSRAQWMSYVIFPVTKVFCFLKIGVKRVFFFRQGEKYACKESKIVKNSRPDYLCITLNLIDDWLKSSSAKQEMLSSWIGFYSRVSENLWNTMKSIPHHAPSLPSFIQFINCGVNEILSFCLLMRMYLHV